MDFGGDVGGLGGLGGRWCIIKALYLVMHRCSLRRRVLACVRPHLFDFFRRFSVIFGVGDGVVPFLLVTHHSGDDFFRVKMLEVLVDHCCHRGEFGVCGDAIDAVDGIFVGAFVEMDVCVSRMRVLLCEVVVGGGGGCRHCVRTSWCLFLC